MDERNPRLVKVPTTTIFESSTSTDAYVQQKIGEILEQGAFRKKALEITKEYTGTVEFMECVQKYADAQIDKRLFKNVGVIMGLIAGWIATAVITYYATKAGMR